MKRLRLNRAQIIPSRRRRTINLAADPRLPRPQGSHKILAGAKTRTGSSDARRFCF
jgi:hypothetical protein